MSHREYKYQTKWLNNYKNDVVYISHMGASIAKKGAKRQYLQMEKEIGFMLWNNKNLKRFLDRKLNSLHCHDDTKTNHFLLFFSLPLSIFISWFFVQYCWFRKKKFVMKWKEKFLILSFGILCAVSKSNDIHTYKLNI